MTRLRPFNEIMRELLQQSGLTREELSSRLSEKLNCPMNNEEGSAPSFDLISAMAEELKPSAAQELELFRAVATLIAADDSKDFGQMFKAYRKGLGLSLESIGNKLEANLKTNKDDLDFNILVTLYEMGERIPDQAEAIVIADYFNLIAKEKTNFVAKANKETAPTLKIVDENYTDEPDASWEEKIKQAEQILSFDTKDNRDFIIGEAAKLLESKKEDQ